MKRKDDMYYWIRRSVTPTWWERLIDWCKEIIYMKWTLLLSPGFWLLVLVCIVFEIKWAFHR